MRSSSNSLFILFFCVILFSCGEPKTYRANAFEISPDSLIMRDLMIRLMVDVHIVEAAMVLKRNEKEVSSTQINYYYHGILDKYHISKKRYDDNLKYYRQNPQEFAKMYETVVQELTKRLKNYTPLK